MDYKQAKAARKKSFSNTLADKITSGGGVGSSIKSTISDKTKASMVGLKETFDPMNIAKGIGGKGLAAATGKLLGRKQEDIEYFAGDGKSLKKEGGDTASEILNSIFKVMKEDREELVKHKEELKSQQKDLEKDEDDWHNKLIEALKYRGKPEGGEPEEPEEPSKKGSKTRKSSPKSSARKSAPKKQSGERTSSSKSSPKSSASRVSKGGGAGRSATGGGAGGAGGVSAGGGAGSSLASLGVGIAAGAGALGIASSVIAKEEGLPKKGKAYWDPPGQQNLVSIGYGHQIKPEEYKQGYIQAGKEQVKIQGQRGIDTTMTPEQAQSVLQADLPKYEEHARKPLGEAWNKLSDVQQAALMSYAYNTGSTASLAKQGIIEPIMKGDTKAAAAIIRDKGTRTAGGTVNNVLVARRAKEAALFESTPKAKETASPDKGKDQKSTETTQAAPAAPPSASSGSKIADSSSKNKELKSTMSDDKPQVIVNNTTKQSPQSGNQAMPTPADDDDRPLYLRKLHG
jgi:GH24 family phage-related lysozyme (muramidase)